MLIAGMNELKEAIAYAKAAESKWPTSMKMPDGQFVMTFDSGEKAPDNEVLGPVTPRGGHSGIVYRGGKVLRRMGRRGAPRHDLQRRQELPRRCWRASPSATG